MADTLSNLLSRSGSPAVGKPAAILQPRLPALYETPRNADEVPAPSADKLEASLSQAQIEVPAPRPPGLTAADPPFARQEPPETPPQEERVSPPGQGPEATIPRARHKRPAAATAPSVPAAERRPGVLPSSAGALRSQLEETTASPARPAGSRSRPATVERETLPQAEPATPAPVRSFLPTPASLPDRQEAALPLTQLRSAAGDQPAAERFSEQPDREPSPGLPAVPVRARPAALPSGAANQASRAAQAAESEPVVQIHIGRIEVRAVTQAAPTPPARPAPAGPKLSLEEYLRQREAKR